MRALLVSPVFPTTYWGFQYALPFLNRRVSLPPLGLVSLAALLPPDWELRLVDLNVRPLRDAELDWADVVLVGGMHVQGASMHEVIARARARGRRTVVGGPAPTTAPGEYRDADMVFRGEAEGRIGELVAALAAPDGAAQIIEERAGSRPDLARAPVPRFDLLELGAYASMAIQYSRGCPYGCEFCDVIEIFGRVPRVKSNAQVLREFEALERLGYRGSLFVVDDNFIGNKLAVRGLLPELVRWQSERGYPYELYTEASVNLASDPELVAEMVESGFSSVFLGIETPSTKTLALAGKQQNLRLDLGEAVRRLTRAGLEVYGGFIVGLDGDDATTFEAQREFISQNPIPLAMVGMLTALPGTALWRRLEREGRLRQAGSGDQFERPNFEPSIDEEVLLRGYVDLVRSLYSPQAYYRRCEAFVDLVVRAPGRRRLRLRELITLARAVARIGVLGSRRRHFWRLLTRTLRRAPHTFPWAVAHTVMGEHAIRYAHEHVAPRIEHALAELQLERARAQRARDSDSEGVRPLPGPDENELWRAPPACRTVLGENPVAG